jgi:hypothetical protein
MQWRYCKLLKKAAAAGTMHTKFIMEGILHNSSRQHVCTIANQPLELLIWLHLHSRKIQQPSMTRPTQHLPSKNFSLAIENMWY